MVMSLQWVEMDGINEEVGAFAQRTMAQNVIECPFLANRLLLSSTLSYVSLSSRRLGPLIPKCEIRMIGHPSVRRVRFLLRPLFFANVSITTFASKSGECNSLNPSKVA